MYTEYVFVRRIYTESWYLEGLRVSDHVFVRRMYTEYVFVRRIYTESWYLKGSDHWISSVCT